MTCRACAERVNSWRRTLKIVSLLNWKSQLQKPCMKFLNVHKFSTSQFQTLIFCGDDTVTIHRHLETAILTGALYRYNDWLRACGGFWNFLCLSYAPDFLVCRSRRAKPGF